MAKITTDRIRGFLCNQEGRDDFDLCDAVEALIDHCDALEEDPEVDYGFEFVVDDENIGNEGTRSIYYAWMLPQELCPEGFTASVYILAPDDGAAEDSEILHYRAVLFDDRGVEMADSEYGDEDRRGERFETLRECIAWLEEQLGWKIPKLPKEES